MRKLHLNAPTSVVVDYFHLFVNRRAYTLQSNRPRSESTRHYYYRPKDKKTGQALSLTLDTIRRHLEGKIAVGLYAINPATQCSKWVAIDADYGSVGGRRQRASRRQLGWPPFKLFKTGPVDSTAW